MGLLLLMANVTGSIRFDDVEIVGLAEKAMRSHRGRGRVPDGVPGPRPGRSIRRCASGGRSGKAIQTHEKTSRAAAHHRALELLELVRLPAAKERLQQDLHQLSAACASA